MNNFLLVCIFVLLSCRLAMCPLQAVSHEEFPKYSLLSFDEYDLKQLSPHDQKQIHLFKAAYAKKPVVENTKSSIPKIMHFICFGADRISLQNVKNLREWSSHHPDWEMILWTDCFRLPPLSQMKIRYIDSIDLGDLKTTFEKAITSLDKSIIARFIILAEMGGLFIDLNKTCHQSLNFLQSSYDFFGYLQSSMHQASGYSFLIANDLIGAKAHHPLLEKCKAILKEQSEKMRWLFPLDNTYLPLDRFYAKDKRALNSYHVSLTLAARSAFSKHPHRDIVLFPKHFATYVSDAQDEKISSDSPSLEQSLKGMKKRQTFFYWLVVALLAASLLQTTLYFVKNRRRKFS